MSRMSCSVMSMQFTGSTGMEYFSPQPGSQLPGLGALWLHAVEEHHIGPAGLVQLVDDALLGLLVLLPGDVADGAVGGDDQGRWWSAL